MRTRSLPAVAGGRAASSLWEHVTSKALTWLPVPAFARRSYSRRRWQPTYTRPRRGWARVAALALWQSQGPGSFGARAHAAAQPLPGARVVVSRQAMASTTK